RLEGRVGRLGEILLAVVTDGPTGKDYRLPTGHEITCARESSDERPNVFSRLRFGIPDEDLSKNRIQGNSGFRVLLYGFEKWRDLFTARQILTLGTLITVAREIPNAGRDIGLS